MYRRFIATIVAASIAVTAMGAVPAHAGDLDTARAIAAILGLAAIGKIIHDEKKKKRAHRQAEPVRKHRHAAPVQKERRYQAPVYQPKARPLPQRANRKLLPGKCFRTFENRQGRVRMFGNRCLQRNYSYTNRLPQQCLYRFRSNDGWKRGYEARCLRDAGYRLARG